MIKLFDTVMIKTIGKKATVLEIDDDNGTKPPSYLVEIQDKPLNASLSDVVFWCGWDEIQEVKFDGRSNS